jgi:hypothetical protein
MIYRLAYSPPHSRGPTAKQQKHVDFHGHTWRVDPATDAKKEVYLMAVDGCRKLIVDCSKQEREQQLWKFIEQAERQLEAMAQNNASDARLEWHFSDPDVARRVRQAFAVSKTVGDALVYYTPKVWR